MLSILSNSDFDRAGFLNYLVAIYLILAGLLGLAWSDCSPGEWKGDACDSGPALAFRSLSPSSTTALAAFSVPLRS